MKRHRLIAVPDFATATRDEALIALCHHACNLSQVELAKRLNCAVLLVRHHQLNVEQQRRLCRLAAATLSLQDVIVELWQPNGQRAEDATVRLAIADKFRDVNPLMAIRRRSNVSVGEFAATCGVSRQRLHMLEHMSSGAGLERAIARAEAVYGHE